MAIRKPGRNEWKLKDGKWRRSLGNRGCRVTLFERVKGGGFYRSVWMPGVGVDRRALGTTGRDEADKLGKELLAALLREEQVVSSGVLPFQLLWDRYRSECVAFQGYTERMKKEIEGRVKVLSAFFGADSDVRDLSEQDQIAFVKKRLAGGMALGFDKDRKEILTRAVRARSAQADMELLRSMLHWATTFRIGKGGRLLNRNPLDGVRFPGRGTNPRRPVATLERFNATRNAIGELQAEAENDSERRKWVKLELALVLAEATGRRMGSIRQLKWEDIDFTGGTILWQADSDKRRKEWRVPMPDDLRDELRTFRVKMGGAFGGMIFPAESDRSTAIRTDVLSRWLRQAEQKAQLKKLDGSLWHSYRRAWATRRGRCRRVERGRYVAPVLSTGGRCHDARCDAAPKQSGRAEKGLIRGTN